MLVEQSNFFFFYNNYFPVLDNDLFLNNLEYYKTTFSRL